MHPPRSVYAIAALVVGLVSSPRAQQADVAAALRARIDRIYTEHAYDAPRFGPARWLPDGTAYAIVERSDTVAEIARYDAATGARSVLASTTLDVGDYAWSSDGRRLLIFTNTKKVWRQNTRGDYWVLDVAGPPSLQSSGAASAPKKLGGSAPEASLMFAKFSPDATRVAYVRQNNIYVERLDTGAIVQLTKDGQAGAAWAPATSGTIVNGTSDWVNEEELGIRDGFRWSPDGRRIAYWQFDTTGVGNYTLIDDTDTLYPTTRVFAYPKPGTTNSAVRCGVVAADGGATIWVKAPGDPRNTYIASLEWIDGSTLALQQLNRLQTENDYLLADASTGNVTRAFHDAALADTGHLTLDTRGWVDVQGDVTWVDNGRAFLWLSERDGWRHLYRVARAGGAKLLTNFQADVIGLEGVDASAAYVLASPSNATQRYLFRVPLDGSAPPRRVTPEDAPGWHDYTFAPGGKMAFHTYSSFERPASMDVVSLPDHRSLRQLLDPSVVRKKVAGVVGQRTDFLTVRVADGVTLDGWMMRPSSFDGSKTYPVIVFVYGEPASQTVTDAWSGGHLFYRALADAGYVVVSFDNRGTPAPKGAAWRKVIYGAVGVLSSQDQAAAIEALAATHSFIDLSRVGIWGWSGGGSNTLNCMFRFPDVYKVGVSVAPVPDQKLYDTIYQERYMGVPEQNAEGYRAGSPINFAEGLKGNLLIVHGSGDDNVHYQGTERLVNRLVELGKPFDLMVYPNRTHAISEGTGTTAHVYQLIGRYFLEHLPPGPR
ncbi:MAG TPA: DPP IV N-terminal domain-containing protein [Vicinamibacterales bacterium]|nr:DPP IV N-terminal domain-containing protein [Vicinamibacterales bacterium]